MTGGVSGLQQGDQEGKLGSRPPAGTAQWSAVFLGGHVAEGRPGSSGETVRVLRRDPGPGW